jgi:hypothetical protein
VATPDVVSLPTAWHTAGAEQATPARRPAFGGTDCTDQVLPPLLVRKATLPGPRPCPTVSQVEVPLHDTDAGEESPRAATDHEAPPLLVATATDGSGMSPALPTATQSRAVGQAIESSSPTTEGSVSSDQLAPSSDVRITPGPPSAGPRPTSWQLTVDEHWTAAESWATVGNRREVQDFPPVEVV